MLRVPLMILLGLAGLAAGGGPAPQKPPTQTTICLEPNGQTAPVRCRAQAGRLDKGEDICLCPRGAPTVAPVCGPGERAPPQSRALERARREAGRDGSLLGDLYQGRAMCVAERQP